jgi:two-component system chemotaxis response regulator CheY
MSGTILVVDDDGGTREVLSEVLGDEGYEVLTASDGREAIEKLAGVVPSLIVLDLLLPAMGGAELVAELERTALRRGVPILLMSAAARADGMASAVAADAFLPKPFDLDIFVGEVARLAGKRRPAAGAADPQARSGPADGERDQPAGRHQDQVDERRVQPDEQV